MFGMQPGYGYSPYFSPQTGQIMAPGIMQDSIGMQAPGMQQNAPQGPQSGPGWIMAQTVKQVEQVSVQPGQKAWIMVQNEPVFALRTADNMGLITTDYYKFEKYDPSAAAPVGPAPTYVTVEQLEERLATFADSLKPTKTRKGDTAE